jgi:hypothetical protein
LWWDIWDHFHYDITQWGRQYIYTWPWYFPNLEPIYSLYWNWWGTDYVGFSSSVMPTSQRSPSPWGLGDYVGHAPGKPPRPGVHWDVEESNLNPQGPPCALYPPAWPIFGQQVAGAESWYLDSALMPGETISHEVLLSIANRPHHGWHWVYDWWYWYNVDWPFPVPTYYYVHHPLGYPWYRMYIGWWYWWHCYYPWPRPCWPVWWGIALPLWGKDQGLEIKGVYAKTLDAEGKEVLQEFQEDAAVTENLMVEWYWPDYEWHGFSHPGFCDTVLAVEVLLEGQYVGMDTIFVHTMIGGQLNDEKEFGWSPANYDSTVVDIKRAITGVPQPQTPANRLVLYPNYPNPFNPSTAIKYYLPEKMDVTLEVYDLTGRLITRLVDERQEPGLHSVEWRGLDATGREVSAGVYIYRLQSGDQVQSQRMNFVK